ncbi:MAG: class I SAM-dependent methyltransferase [Saprospiraceae bacterium]
MAEFKRKELFILRPLLVQTVVNALHSIFVEGRYADKVIEYTLKNSPKAGSSDRSFIAETTYEVVRYFRLYSELLGKKPTQTDDFWQLVGIHFILKNKDLPQWEELRTLNAEQIRAKYDAIKDQLAIRESIPDWLNDMCAAELGEQWGKTMNFLNRPAHVVLRTNTLKTDTATLLKELREEGIDAKQVGKSNSVLLLKRKNAFRTVAFKKGMFEVQDYSSQLVAPFLAPEPGMRVVDACAGAGGKTLHLAALMESKGQLLALDTLEWKLQELKLRARRAGVSNIQIRTIENSKTIKRLHNSADRLLLDVPCSGLGVLRRNPDSKWKLSPEMIDSLKETQAKILDDYSKIVKPGGKMVYATCSILPSENEKQVERFLATEFGKEFTLEEEKKILPQDDGFDGFYMARLVRKA